jgi:hypothetical protein
MYIPHMNLFCADINNMRQLNFIRENCQMFIGNREHNAEILSKIVQLKAIIGANPEYSNRSDISVYISQLNIAKRQLDIIHKYSEKIGHAGLNREYVEMAVQWNAFIDTIREFRDTFHVYPKCKLPHTIGEPRLIKIIENMIGFCGEIITDAHETHDKIKAEYDARFPILPVPRIIPQALTRIIPQTHAQNDIGRSAQSVPSLTANERLRETKNKYALISILADECLEILDNSDPRIRTIHMIKTQSREINPALFMVDLDIHRRNVDKYYSQIYELYCQLTPRDADGIL